MPTPDPGYASFLRRQGMAPSPQLAAALAQLTFIGQADAQALREHFNLTTTPK